MKVFAISNKTSTMSAVWLLLTVLAILLKNASTKLASLHPVLVARSSLDWMPSRVNSLYSDVGAWSGKFRPVMDEIESDEALRFYQFLNYLDGSSFGTGPIDEFVDAMGRLANYMKQQNSRETQARGMRELEAINGEKGNSIKTVLEVSTLIMRKKRKFFCTGEVKEPIVNNKIICKDRILLPIAGASCRDAIMYWHPDLTEEHYCVGALEAKSAVHIMDIEGTTLAQSGGDYHYINEAYGPLPAFLYLWDANLVFVPSTNAIMSLTFANNILEPIFPDCPIDPLCRKLIAAVTICFLTFINAYDVRFTTRIQNVFMFTKITALVIIIVGGIIWMSKGGTEHFEDGWAGTKSSVSDWSVAFYSGIFSYSGWNYLNFMTEELKDPFVNLPRAIYVSLPMVTAIYLLANVAYLAVLGPVGVLATEAIAVDFAVTCLGFLRWAMPTLVAIAILGGLSVHIMTSSRMCFAGARNGHMPELLAHINVKCMSPMPSLVFLMLISILMLIPDNLTSLITYCTVVESFFTTLSCSAVLWLRYKRPDLPRPIKVQLWMPIVFVSISAVLLVVPVVSEPFAVIAGALITLAGVPVYFGFVRSKPKCVAEASTKFTHCCQKLFLSAVEEKEE